MLIAGAVLACTGGSSSAPTPTTSPEASSQLTPTATAAGLGPPEPDTERILEHIRFFSEEIGPRPAGSSQEEAAIAYAREQFERSGYDVEVQPFAVERPDFLRPATLSIDQPRQQELLAIPFTGSAEGEVSGRLLDAGTGREEDFTSEMDGTVVLIQRQDVFFREMARRAQAAGAVAVVIANREAGLFIGEIDPPTTLPVLAIEQADGEALRDLLAAGSVEVSVRVEGRDDVTAHNVIARPASGECRTLSGGHYDSVPWAAGANDNASGSALVLELARAAAAAGLSGHCFALFGAEELGLLGSAFFISELTEGERDALEAVYNYDVVAGDARLLAISNPGELLDRALALANEMELSLDSTTSVEDIGSDHRSFLDAGIPTLMLTTPDFDLIHSVRDTLAGIESAPLGMIASLAFALLAEAGEAA